MILSDAIHGAPAAIWQDWLHARSTSAALPDMGQPLLVHDGIAIVPVHGVITSSQTVPGQAVASSKVARDVRAAVADPAVSAVLMHVNSPGGSTTGLIEAAAELRAARDAGKPIVAMVQYMAASAAYWLAAQASEIVATPSAQVGSIGVYMMHVDQSASLERDGMRVTYISAGKDKVLGNSTAPLSDDALAYYQAQVDEAYAAFVADVAAGRGVSEDTVRSAQFGEGRIFSAGTGLANGLIDRIAPLGQVLAEIGVKSRANRPALESRRRAMALINITLE